MGSYLEINDALRITAEQGFPAEILNLEKHRTKPIQLATVADKIFEFKDKPDARIYHRPTTRCFLVQDIGGKWLYWGHVFIVEQTIKCNADNTATTSGKFKIIQIYDPAYQAEMTKRESRDGLSYF
ncbi:MAG: hypothetical protein A3J93_03020 [Candidatus Magasanikbacteria bacterium RIFOXYC2_FULL_42_28]|uniref:Uncharacterized protein n=1 Tax=Candidatus Magasanikbacteria bacterium RIFOXYC2_FULL_42_28 TaxID=1798704 RepID=A0A1F6NU79_9BACT|nr:MAG: hypothetical protein A3J93_03020 [Candidatus Magasanikbacteria bacterium RIFOXYC2_FULL_42_28]